MTVLIAAYNAAEFIPRAIQSALSQIPAPLEVLVIDDASTDHTVKVVRQIADAEPSVRLITLPDNRGPAGARNAGLDAARGEWIAVLDADDAYLPGRLAALLETAAGTDADVVADSFEYYDARTQEITGPALQREPPIELIAASTYIEHSNPFGIEADWGMLKPIFRKAFLDTKALRYPAYSRHGEDFLFAVDILLAGGRYVIDRRPYYLYTTRDSGMSRTLVDYEAMSRQSARLLQDPRVMADKRLRSVVQGRVRAVRRLSAERKLVARIVARDVLGVLWLGMTNRWAARGVARRLLARVGPIFARQ